MDKKKITAVVVTYNRKNLLIDCINALKTQTRLPDRIIIIDNASSDDTQELFENNVKFSDNNINYFRLEENLGGAGGFAEGIRQAIAFDTEWIWLMDDDALPQSSALEELMAVAEEPSHVYGSLAIIAEYTAWDLHLVEMGGGKVNRVEDIPSRARVQFLPFLGFMIHREMVERIGLPDAGFFIAADDVEYCMRAERAGAHIIVAGKSHINHPKSDLYFVKLPGKIINCLRLPPWKRYYDVRNRLLIARKYYGYRLFTQTIPGSFIRLFGTLYNEPQKGAQIWAFVAGFIDGMLGIKGRRHASWYIR